MIECFGENLHEVVIIGAGPAGISAALQLKRAGITALLFEPGRVGGLLHNAHLVENYLGFPKAIAGRELAGLFAKQLASVGVGPVAERVCALSFERGRQNFRVKTDRSLYWARIAVVASGTKARSFDDCVIPNSVATRVYYEVCDLKELRNCHIAIIGGGDAAFDYAMSLAQHNRVYILHRSELPRCLPLLSQRVDVHPHISYHPQTAIYRIDGDDDQIVLSLQQNSDQPRHYHLQTYIGDRQARVTALSHRSSSTPSEHHTANTKSSPHLLTSTPQIWNLQIDALLFAIGREPCLDFLDISEHTQLASLLATGRLHIIGDVQRGYFRQVAIATGDGTYAAMQIQHTLQDPAGFGTHQL